MSTDSLELWLLNVKGGTSASILEDYDQAKRIVRLIGKVDALIRTKSNDLRLVVRRNRENLIAALPPRRVWLSIKLLRSLEHDDTDNQTTSVLNNGGKEDAIVDGKPSIHMI